VIFEVLEGPIHGGDELETSNCNSRHNEPCQNISQHRYSLVQLLVWFNIWRRYGTMKLASMLPTRYGVLLENVVEIKACQLQPPDVQSRVNFQGIVNPLVVGYFPQVQTSMYFVLFTTFNLLSEPPMQLLHTNKKVQVTLRLGGQSSAYFPILQGVAQGCPLSPIIFNIYVDDLLKRTASGWPAAWNSFC
jgi:hypothetical protein